MQLKQTNVEVKEKSNSIQYLVSILQHLIL
nr:MAG TPA: hypothetical protein [Bacteriophage sp.]